MNTSLIIRVKIRVHAREMYNHIRPPNYVEGLGFRVLGFGV